MWGASGCLIRTAEDLCEKIFVCLVAARYSDHRFRRCRYIITEEIDLEGENHGSGKKSPDDEIATHIFPCPGRPNGLVLAYWMTKELHSK